MSFFCCVSWVWHGTFKDTPARVFGISLALSFGSLLIKQIGGACASPVGPGLVARSVFGYCLLGVQLLRLRSHMSRFIWRLVSHINRKSCGPSCCTRISCCPYDWLPVLLWGGAAGIPVNATDTLPFYGPKGKHKQVLFNARPTICVHITVCLSRSHVEAH